ncbi:MAG: hypothetical protein WBA31_04370 [Candidatus Dormiibacterota bacterium]
MTTTAIGAALIVVGAVLTALGVVGVFERTRPMVRLSLTVAPEPARITAAAPRAKIEGPQVALAGVREHLEEMRGMFRSQALDRSANLTAAPAEMEARRSATARLEGLLPPGVEWRRNLPYAYALTTCAPEYWSGAELELVLKEVTAFMQQLRLPAGAASR